MPPKDDPSPPLAAHLAEHEDDENAWQTGYIKGTDFSLPYYSPWSRLYGDEVKEGHFRGINCSYFSTPGVPPTLLALKQHAQALCRVIQAIDPTEDSKEILAGRDGQNADGEAAILPKYTLNEAFDFLTNLAEPYHNDDPSHHKPLTMLLNEVRSRHEAYGVTTYHCPFHEAGKPRAHGAPSKPYATHQSLIRHANDCLERLDHEFSSTGGILSLLPTNAPHDAPDLYAARNSLLGQWLLHTQTLTARMHELEAAYANALDGLAGEAHIPHQVLSELGPDGRAARTLAYPQDKWVLVNAGEDVFRHVHALLDKQEATIQAREQAFRDMGAVGDHIWKTQRGGEDYARGIVPVTLNTRYFRIMGQGHHTLFVVPAFENHPAVEATRLIEGNPTIVATPEPKFPKRVSQLEKKWEERIERAKEAEVRNMQLANDVERAREEVRSMKDQMELLTKTRDELAKALGKDGGVKGRSGGE